MVAMNSKGIVHRDLKPQNILLAHDGKSRNPHPADIRYVFQVIEYCQKYEKQILRILANR